MSVVYGLTAGAALVGLLQCAVWIGQPSAPVGRRLFAIFAAPVAVVALGLSLVALRLAVS